MRKKTPPRLESQNEWFVASLKPAAKAIFNDTFYPTPTARTGEQKVFVAINPGISENPNTIKVRVMNGLNIKSIRMMSGSLANNCLDIKRKVTKPEFEKINSAISATY
jgi:hypothetical protein